MTVDLDRWLQPDVLWLLAGMSGAAIYGAVQPLSPWTRGDPVIGWALIAATALTLLTCRKVVLE
jgi:hypothetical protein